MYQWVVKKTYSVKPEFIIALGPNQAKHLAKVCFKDDAIKTLLLPCGFFEDEAPKEHPEWFEQDKITIGYCGNIHFHHNPNFIKFMIDHIDPKRQKLILALYGDKSADVIAYAKGKPGVFLTQSVPRNELTYIDVHMVSLLPDFTHYAVPSKAVSAVTMKQTILFTGSKESDSWELFKETGWFIKDDENMQQGIADFCKNITKEEVMLKQKNTPAVSNELRTMVNDTHEFVTHFNTL